MQVPVCPMCNKPMSPVEFRYTDGDPWFGWHCECTHDTRYKVLDGTILMYESNGEWRYETGCMTDGIKQIVYVGANATPSPGKDN